MLLSKQILQIDRTFGMACAYKNIISPEKSEIIVLKEEIYLMQNTLNTWVPTFLDIDSTVRQETKFMSPKHHQYTNERSEITHYLKCDQCNHQS